MTSAIGLAGFLDRGRRSQIHDVPEPDHAAKIRVLLNHGGDDVARLVGVPVGRLIGDELDLGMFGEDVLGALQHSAVRPGGRLPDQYRDLPACPGAAAIDDRLRLRFADGDPIGADIGVGIVVRPHADLDDVNAGVFGALQQLRIRLDIEIMGDDDVRLFRYQRGDGLRADVGAEMRVADLEFHPEAIGLLLQRRQPIPRSDRCPSCSARRRSSCRRTS